MVKMLLRNASLRGRRLKGKGKGVLGARETRELNDQAGSDLVKCQAKMRAFAFRICSEF